MAAAQIGQKKTTASQHSTLGYLLLSLGQSHPISDVRFWISTSKLVSMNIFSLLSCSYLILEQHEEATESRFDFRSLEKRQSPRFQW